MSEEVVGMNRVIGTFWLVVTLFLLLGSAGAEDSLSLEESVRWLSSEAVRVVRGSVIEAHDGTKLFTPDGSAHYRALAKGSAA